MDEYTPSELSKEPLLSVERPYRGVVPFVLDTPQVEQRALLVLCTVAGNVSIVFQDGSAMTFPVSVGLTILPFCVTTVASAGTTATATFFNLA